MTETYLSPYESPFRAGFGVDPPYLAGRAELLHTMLAAIAAGPGRPGYLTILLGGRGVGKTVLLNHVRDAVHADGSATVTWSAGPSTSLGAKLGDEYNHCVATLRSARSSRVTTASAGINVGVAHAELSVGSVPSRPGTVPGLLTALGREAAQRRRTMVLLVDELQGIEPLDAHALVTALQETNAQRLPVALVAAGLPTVPARLRGLHGTTFLERQHRTVVGRISDDDAALALSEPLQASGRPFDPHIIDPLVAFAEGYPYAVQLVGHHAWLAAGDESTIDLGAARRGVEAAGLELDVVYEGRWSQLGDVQRGYLCTVIDQLDPDGAASSSSVAAALGGTTKRFSVARDALITTHQLLYSDGRDQLRLALPGFDRWLRRRNTRHD